MTKKWDTHPGEALRVRAGFDLGRFDHAATPGWSHGEKHAVKAMARRGRELSTLQEKLFANGTAEGATRSVLLVLQGMDTAGKGGIVRHVVGMVDPRGVKHHAFGVPTEDEREHHYLWRVRNALPPAGMLGVFDRSHFEQVLVVRVHDLVPPATWEGYYDELNAFEAEVAASGTAIVKCALLVSLDEQRQRLEARLEDRSKYWKYNPKDIDERGLWDDYMAAYQAMLERTSTAVAPWHAVPADDKWFARHAITELLTSAIEGLGLSWPPPDFDVAAERARVAALEPKR